MTNDLTAAVAELPEGPQIAGYTCLGCRHFQSEYWREPSGDGETWDSGTSADCRLIGKNISTYFGSEPHVPDWCPKPASGALVPAADVQGLQDYDADLIKRLRDCANGIGNFKTERGDYGLCDDAADAIARVTEEKDEAISHAIYNAQYVDLVSQYKARAETADAAVAAALMQAVETIRKKIYPLGKSEDWSPMGAHLAEGLDLAIAAILALITPDAMAALEAVKAEARKDVADMADELLHAATELAQLASYSEIVGGISHNRSHIRKWCDEVFAIRKRLPEDENYDPSFAALEGGDAT